MKCRRYQAEHEIFVADFYWRTEKYNSAWKRYEYVVENYQDLPDIVQYARRRGKLAYFLYQKKVSELKRKQEQGSWKQWFDWL